MLANCSNQTRLRTRYWAVNFVDTGAVVLDPAGQIISHPNVRGCARLARQNVDPITIHDARLVAFVAVNGEYVAHWVLGPSPRMTWGERGYSVLLRHLHFPIT